MRHHSHTLIRLILCLTLLVALVGMLPAVIAQDGDNNLLQNGGFEGTYVAVGGDPTLEVAPNWQPWSLPPPEGEDSSAINLRPDYQAAPANRVHGGSAAQEYNTFFATHDGGVYQRVPVEPGALLEFSAFVYVWSSATFENPDESIQPQDVDVQVGIDPTGGQDGSADTVIWSDAQRFYDEYQELTVNATAEANAVTVFVRSVPTGAIGVNNIYVDDASLIQTGILVEQTQEPLPVPTEEVLEPTAEATLEATSEATAEPTEESGGNDTTGNDTTGNSTTGTNTTGTGTTSTGNNSTAATATVTPIPNDPALANLPNRITYVVQAGDTLFRIATLNRSTVEAISAANGLGNANLIFVGQSLVVPVPAGTPNSIPSTTATPTTTTATPLPTGGTTTGTYVVSLGEGLYSIAQRFNTTVEALATLNNIINPNLIAAGTVLRVPVTNVPPVATPIPGGNPGTGGPTTVTHVVQPGQNAFRIGLLYNITVETLAQANRLTNPNLIYVGQVLIIPR